jgi:hypothetical protein
MVDSVSSSLMSAMFRAPPASASAGIAALKSNQAAQQAIINQLQQGLDAGKALTVSNTQQTVPAQQSSGGGSANLPRGSLVDLLA